MIDWGGEPVNELLSGQTGSGTASVLRTASEKIEAETYKELPTVGRAFNYYLLDVRLARTDTSPPPSDGRRSDSVRPR
jgi:hypothetical protein